MSRTVRLKTVFLSRSFSGGGTYENALDVLKKRVKIRFCLCAGGKSCRIKKLQTHRRRYDKKYQRREDK